MNFSRQAWSNCFWTLLFQNAGMREMAVGLMILLLGRKTFLVPTKPAFVGGSKVGPSVPNILGFISY